MTDDAEEYARSFEILSGAHGLEGDALEQYLDGACDGDESLRARVLQLLAACADGEAGSGDAFADEQLAAARQTLDELASQASTTWMPETIGDYQVLRQIGSGGMGVVYEAQQSSPRRRVALKVLSPLHASGDGLKRFRREAELLGRLQHPGIAHIFEASTFDVGHGRQPYFVMELVEGLPITEYADDTGLDTNARMALVAELCDVIEYAHERGVIHRDLKPANILANSRTATGTAVEAGASTTQLKILDFGIARVVDPDLTSNTLQTSTGQIVGTVSYMSPEQAMGDPDAIDVRSDVYTLGVLAYELLSHSLPIPSKGLMLHDAVRAIREDEPTGLGTIDRGMRGDIEVIVGKALEKEPDRRYASAAAMAADIRRYLADEPILGRRPTTVYQLRKFARRNKALVAGVVATLAVALIGSVVAIGYALDSKRRADELGRVAEFYSSQWALIDLGDMAERLKNNTVEGVITELRRQGGGAEGDARIREFEQLLESADFATIAMRFLDETLFATGLETLNQQFEDLPLVQARLLETLSQTMLRLGLVDSSVPLQERALELHRRELGPGDLLSLRSQSLLGNLRFSKSRYQEAVELLRSALRQQRTLLPRTSQDLRDSLTWLGSTVSVVGPPEDMISIRREIANLTIEIAGRDDADALLAQADVLCAEGRNDVGVELMKRGLALFKRDRGEHDISTLIVTGNIASELLHLGQLEEAEGLARTMLVGSREQLGEPHPQTTNAMCILGQILRDAGKFEEAEAHLRNSLKLRSEHLGPDDRATIQSRHHLELLLDARAR